MKVAAAYSYKTVTTAHKRELYEGIREVLDSDGPVFCNVEISPEHRVIPQAKFGRPIDDAEPLLDRKEFLENMLVKPVEAALQ